MSRVLRNSILFMLLLAGSRCWSQSDTLPYTLFGKKLVLYSDLGFNTAPINISYKFSDGIRRLRYRNNSTMVLGLGVSYRWFALRLGINLPVSLRSSKYGTTRYFDLGFDFTVKRVFFDTDFHLYQGYAIKKAYRWDSAYDKITPHQLRPDINSASFSLNAWVFRSKLFKMEAMRGKTGSYNKDVQTFYFRNTINLHGVGTDDNAPLIPYQLHDSTNSKTLSNSFTAFDFGVIPGYAYVKRWKEFQIGAMGGLGLVVQAKFYSFEDQTRGFLGLAPRVDVKLIAGYNKPRYFVMFVTDFDNKSIRFNGLRYAQTYYQLKVVGGIRLDTKREKKEAEKAKKQKTDLRRRIQRS